MSKKPQEDLPDAPEETQLRAERGRIQIWRVDLTDPSWSQISPNSYLSPGEIDRANRYVLPHPQLQYLRSHIALRCVLGRELQTLPNLIEFVEAEGGKPGLRNGGGLEFNLSHSGEMALIALANAIPVGIDVEHHRASVRVRDLARRYFSVAEAVAVAEAGRGTHSDVFYRIWTRKEACIKAWGNGLRTPLDSFDVLGDPPPPVRTHGKLWTVVDVPVVTGYSAAVCFRNRRIDCEVLDWTPEALVRTTRNLNRVQATR